MSKLYLIGKQWSHIIINLCKINHKPLNISHSVYISVHYVILVCLKLWILRTTWCLNASQLLFHLLLNQRNDGLFPCFRNCFNLKNVHIKGILTLSNLGVYLANIATSLLNRNVRDKFLSFDSSTWPIHSVKLTDCIFHLIKIKVKSICLEIIWQVFL